MQDHNVNYINYDKIKISDIHTIIQPGDIVISNPPFSKSKELVQEFDKYNIKFMVICFWMLTTCLFFIRSKMFKDVNFSKMINVKDWTNINKVVGISFCNNIGIKYYKDEMFLNKPIGQYDGFYTVTVIRHTNKKNYHLFCITTQDDKRLFLKTMFFDELNQEVLDKIKDIAAKNNYKIINIQDLKVTYYYDKSCHELRRV